MHKMLCMIHCIFIQLTHTSSVDFIFCFLDLELFLLDESGLDYLLDAIYDFRRSILASYFFRRSILASAQKYMFIICQYYKLGVCFIGLILLHHFLVHTYVLFIFSDPYLNTDAGTMSPFEHGEVFVLDDGGEVSPTSYGNYKRLFLLKTNWIQNYFQTGIIFLISLYVISSCLLLVAELLFEIFFMATFRQVDLDLGNYERFLDVRLTRDNNITTGKIYQVLLTLGS